MFYNIQLACDLFFLPFRKVGLVAKAAFSVCPKMSSSHGGGPHTNKAPKPGTLPTLRLTTPEEVAMMTNPQWEKSTETPLQKSSSEAQCDCCDITCTECRFRRVKDPAAARIFWESHNVSSETGKTPPCTWCAYPTQSICDTCPMTDLPAMQICSQCDRWFGMCRYCFSIRKYEGEGSRQDCAACGRTFFGGRHLSKCGKCLLVRYCGKECQLMDWQTHRKLCKVLRSKTNETIPLLFRWSQPQTSSSSSSSQS